MESNRNYEYEIDKMAGMLIKKQAALKMVLRNYDELVKQKYFSDKKDTMKEYPYWCYGVVVNNDLLKGDK